MGRTGGHSMTDLFKMIGLKDSYHERGLGRNNTTQLVYSIDKTPDEMRVIAHTWAMAVKDDYFETSWPMKNLIYLAKRYVPDLNIIIMLRDPTEYANSNQAHRCRIKLFQSLNDIAELWFLSGHFICRQLECLKYKPYLMRLEDYTTGKHNEFLLDLYKMNTKKNRDIFDKHIKKKTNHVVDYNNVPLSSAVLKRCLEVEERIKGLTISI